MPVSTTIDYRNCFIELLLIISNAFELLIETEACYFLTDAFEKCYLFETSTFLRDTIMLHYTNELKSQAARILGSVDFLGNPLGLFSDVTEGISGFIDEGNIGGLIKNITHGVTNTAAKVLFPGT